MKKYRRKSSILSYGSPKDLALRFPALQKNLDTMKLLVSYPGFQKDVKEARDYLKIPVGGVDAKDQKANQKWHDDHIDRSDKMLDSEEFKIQERRIREKLQNKEITRRIANKQSHLLYSKVPINYFTNISKFLAQKFNLP